MRGYLATVIGALVFFVPAYGWSGRRLGSFLVSMAESTPGHQTEFHWIAAAYASAFFLSALAGAAGATLALQATRSPAAVETGVAVLLVLFVGIEAQFVVDLIAESRGADFRVNSLIAWIGVLVLFLIAARWLGLRWHAWARGRAESERTDVA